MNNDSMIMKRIMIRMAGYENVGFQNAVFLSERNTADRNQALAYFMREYECFPRLTKIMYLKN